MKIKTSPSVNTKKIEMLFVRSARCDHMGCSTDSLFILMICPVSMRYRPPPH